MVAVVELNLLLIVLAGVFGGLIASRSRHYWDTAESIFIGFIVGAWAMGLSLLGWIIYIAYHFVSRYW